MHRGQHQQTDLYHDGSGGGMSARKMALEALNYYPTDPDKMRIVVGKTCGDCAHIYRCKAMFGHVETDTYCDWSPSRFYAASATALPLPKQQAAQHDHV